MMRIVLRLWLFMMGCCCVVLTSFAYEVGDLEVLSSANEPLEGRIALSSNLKDKNNPIIVDVASKIDYMRHKVRRNYYISDLEVAIEHDVSGEPYIRVKSSEPMMARTIEFLVMMLTAEDQSFAKYRFVLPQLRDQNSPPVIAQNRLLSPQKRMLLAHRAASAEKAKRARAVGRDTKLYQVMTGDSLSKIAMKLARYYPQFQSWRPLMKQLAKLNPDAFPKGDINRLEVSTILKLPIPSHWKADGLLAASSEKEHKNKIDPASNHQKVKVASWQGNHSVGINNKKQNTKVALHNSHTLKSTNKAAVKRLKTRKLSPLIARASHQPKRLSYSTLNAMSVQNENSGNYQTQGVVSGALM